MSEQAGYDIGILIPLEEEFNIFTDIFEKGEYSVIEGETYFEIELFEGHRAIVAIIGEMGTTQAALSTQKMLTNFDNLATVVLIGIGGALDEELGLGDVVIGDEIKSYLSKAKAVGNENDYEIEYSGVHWRIPQDLRNHLINFQHKHENIYQRWKNEAHQFQINILDNHSERIESQLITDHPKFHVGHVASGDIVSASEAHGKELKSLDRKLVAIEMEAGGFFAAVDRFEGVQPLMIRGISDFADERKYQLDNQDGIWRIYAMHNASLFLKYLFSSEEFLDVSLDPDKIEAMKSSADRTETGTLTKKTSDISTEYAYHLAFKRKSPPSDYLTEEEKDMNSYTPELRRKVFERLTESSTEITSGSRIQSEARGRLQGLQIKASVLDGGHITGSIGPGETLTNVISINNHRANDIEIEIHIESVQGLLNIGEDGYTSISDTIQMPSRKAHAAEHMMEFPLSVSEPTYKEGTLMTHIKVRDKLEFGDRVEEMVLEQCIEIR